MKKLLDVRTSVLIVVASSGAAVVSQNFTASIFSAILILLFNIYFKTDLKGILKKCKRLLQVVIFAAVMQSIFIKAGKPLLVLYNITFMTDYGMVKGAIILLRLFIIIAGTAVLAQYTQAELIEALVRFMLPYEFAYMIVIGVKFLPTLKEEMQDSLIAIQLRGIEIKKIKLVKKIRLYSYLLFPIVSGAIVRARDLSQSMEMRGFRAFKKRTSMLALQLEMIDILVGISYIAIQIFIIIWS